MTKRPAENPAAPERPAEIPGQPNGKLGDTLAALVSSGCSILAAQTVFHLPAFESQAIEPTVQFVAAAIASFLGFNIPTAALLAFTHGGNVRRVWEACYFWTLPYYVVAGTLIGLYGSTRPTLGWQSLVLILPMVFLFYQTYRTYMKRLDNQRVNASRDEQLYLRTIETLALAIGAKDRQMEGHLHRVQVYASAIGKEMKLSQREMKCRVLSISGQSTQIDLCLVILLVVSLAGGLKYRARNCRPDLSRLHIARSRNFQ